MCSCTCTHARSCVQAIRDLITPVLQVRTGPYCFYETYNSRINVCGQTFSELSTPYMPTAVTALQKSSRGTARAQREVAQSSVENMGSLASDIPRRRAGWQVVKRNTPFAIQRCCDPAPKKKRRDPSVSPVRLRIFSHHKQTAYCSHDNSVGPAGSVGANLKK